LAYRAVSDSTACPAVEAGGAAGGTVAIDGCAMVGWVSGAGSTGPDPGPDGGARFMAGPVAASGTAFGGTGGGRSENIWAEAEIGIKAASIVASASRGRSRLPRPCPPMPSRIKPIGMLFTENAANSSLRDPTTLVFWNPGEQPILIMADVVQSYSVRRA